jgi:hypothetical protein
MLLMNSDKYQYTTSLKETHLLHWLIKRRISVQYLSSCSQDPLYLITHYVTVVSEAAGSTSAPPVHKIQILILPASEKNAPEAPTYSTI